MKTPTRLPACPGTGCCGAFLLGRCWHEISAHAAGERGAGGAVSGSGDVNGSGTIDLSDPVYLLSFLFLGGPGPLPCPGSGPGSGLPDTGQTQCYDCSGQPRQCLDCSGRPRPCEGFTEDSLTLQDAFQRRGCPNDASRYKQLVDDFPNRPEFRREWGDRDGN